MYEVVDWLVDLPIVVSFLVVGAVWILIAAAAVWAGNRLLKPEVREDSKDSLYRLLAVVSSFYAFLIGFVIAQEWSDVNNARTQVSQEAAALSSAAFNAYGLPPSAFGEMSTALTVYNRSVVCVELPGLERSPDPSSTTRDALAAAYRKAVTLPSAVRNDPSYSDMVGALSSIVEARRGRINAAATRMPTALFVVILLSGLILVVVASLQGVKHERAHYVTVIGAAVFVALGQGLVINLSRPFAGAATVSDAPLREGVRPAFLDCRKRLPSTSGSGVPSSAALRVRLPASRA